MMRILTTLTLILLVFTIEQTYASRSFIIEHGKTKKWHGVKLDHCKERLGRDGTREIVLNENEYQYAINKSTIDLILHFNNDKMSEGIGNYKIEKQSFRFDSIRKVFGSSSAKFMHPANTLVLKPKAQSIFNKTQHIGSFTIEFWLNPAILSDGEIIFSKYGPVIKQKMVSSYSGIICKIQKRRLVWELHHIFHRPVYSEDSEEDSSIPLISITSPNRIKRWQWNHHALSFDAMTGKLTYYINSREVKSLFITQSEKQPKNEISNLPEETILTPRFYPQEKSMLVIGKKYYGFIDEFLISTVCKTSLPKILRYFEENRDKQFFNIQKYVPKDGYVTSNVMDIDMTGSFLKRVKLNVEQNKGSSIVLQYRMHNLKFDGSIKEIILPWINLDTNSPSFLLQKKVRGRFFQWRAILKRGKNGNFTPVLKDVAFYFERDISPSPPKNLVAFSSEGRVYLKWQGNVESDISHYKIYFGIETKNYINQEEPIENLKKIEPIIVNVNALTDRIHPVYVISNILKINKVYYFVVTAVDKNGHESNASNEVYVKIRLNK